jgi:hypothetical protein
MARPQRQGNNPGIPFDPLQYMKRLEAVGFTREQAEAQAETFLTIVQEQLITKQDLKEVEAQLTSQIKELESKTTLEFESIRRDIKESEMNARNQSELLRRDLKIWFGGMLVTLVIVLSTVQAVIAHFASH